MRVRISARKSDLARLQAYMVGDALKEKNPQLEIQYKFKESLGDINLTEPLWKIPEKGVFTEDFYSELLRDEADLIVHSWKDLPTEVKPDTMIAATLPRADQRDLLLFKKSHFEKVKTSKTLKIFSSSPRREYNLTDFFKDCLPFGLETVKFESVRGNILTRVRKLIEAEETDGLIVAKAAFDRLLTASRPEFDEGKQTLKEYLAQLDFVVLPLSINPNAAAQGALAIEILRSREDLKEILKTIHDEETFRCAQRERDVLSSFGGGCHQKIGVAALSRPYGEITVLKGLADSGQVLDRKEIENQAPSQFTADDCWVSDIVADRQNLSEISIPSDCTGVFVARTDAWTESWNQALTTFKKQKGPLHYTWTAGLKTWKALAQKGIWVHGSCESLGETEETRIDILAGQAIKWAKISHEEGFESSASNVALVPTYKLTLPQIDKSSLQGKKSFYWNSGSQFLNVLKAAPELLTAHHASGPGNTHTIIKNYLVEKKIYDPKKLQIFLDQESWRKNAKNNL